tara:strand:- start:330 stop:458 length:129 start_codon:yes stop_codon:yes gene_type:complete
LKGFISPDKFERELEQLAKLDTFNDLKRFVETIEKSGKTNKD